MYSTLSTEMWLSSISGVCPSIVTIFINTYQDSTLLMVRLSQRKAPLKVGPLAMHFYTIATLSLSQIQKNADDASACRGIQDQRTWRDSLVVLLLSKMLSVP